MTEVMEGSPKGPPHVNFAHQTELSTIPNIRQGSSSQSQLDPETPPQTGNDLPTPPNSHIEISHHTQPLAAQSSAIQPSQNDASTTQNDIIDSQSQSTIDFDHSPSMEVIQRRVQKGSQISSNNKIEDDDQNVGTSSASTSKVEEMNAISERQTVLAEAEQRGRRKNRNFDAKLQREEEEGSSRSRTPSPIIGSVINPEGRLSYTASFIPSPEEVRSLLYSPHSEKGVEIEEERSSLMNKDSLDELLKRLASMGLAGIEDLSSSNNNSREQDLASMVKKLIIHSKQQVRYIDNIEKTLHKTRIRSISMLTSLQTTFAHTLASEYSLRARVESELEGARMQAKKLSNMLARSESRNEENDRERAMSAEEEVLWQEEMKDHASAYAQQQAARAKASQMAYAQSQGQKLNVPVDAIKSEIQTVEPDTSLEKESSSPIHGTTSPLVSSGKPLEEPFEGRRGGDEIIITGLGISAGATTDAAMNLSPLSTIVKERNKLLSDKRHLKNRVRDIEAQRDRLEIELRNMRPLLVRGGASKGAAASASIVNSSLQISPSHYLTPSTSSKNHKRDRSRRRKLATMGDAEAEHLLLAARRLKEINKLRNFDEDGRSRTPPMGATPSTLPRTPKTPRTVTTTTPRSIAGRDMMESVHHSGASSRVAANGSPLASRNTGQASLGRWGGHERTDSGMSASGIDDLLHAAQTVLTPGKKAGHKQSHSRSRRVAGTADSGEDDENDEEDGDTADQTVTLSKAGISARDFASLNDSPKRRRVSTAGVELDRSRKSWDVSSDKRGLAAFQGSGIRRSRVSTEGAEPQMSQSSGLSALDLLADQAAASQHPSQSSDPSHSGEGEPILEADEFPSDYDDDEMNIDEEDEEGAQSTLKSARNVEEGLIGSHQYPRGAYGHSYAQQPNMISHDLYRSPNPSAYTYTSAHHTPINSQGSWSSSQYGINNSPRNGIYAPVNGSPPMNGSSRFSGPTPTYHTAHRFSTGTMHPSYHQAAKQNNIDEGALHQNSNNQGNNRNINKGGNTSPDKRLPYVRWSDEEDQKLKKAIQEHGQRWESVARVVGTRSYHQCRQRYLLMRRKEAAAREGNTSEDTRSNSHQMAATRAH